jgi:hypothetical protein
VVACERPSAHCCWQRQLAQRPLVLLRDGSLLEVALRERAEVVEAWRAPPDAVPPRLLGALQVQPAAQPRTGRQGQGAGRVCVCGAEGAVVVSGGCGRQ